MIEPTSRPSRAPYILIAAALLVLGAACSVGGRTVIVTATPAGGVRLTFVPSPTSLTPEPTALESATGPYTSAVALLDGVCYEFLASIAGGTWTWTSPDDLNAFYDSVDESELCARPVSRAEFDFDEQVLVGAVSAASGCDAAYRLVESPDGGDAEAQVTVEFVVQPGCDYELVEPFLVTVPRPPDSSQAGLRVIMP